MLDTMECNHAMQRYAVPWIRSVTLLSCRLFGGLLAPRPSLLQRKGRLGDDLGAASIPDPGAFFGTDPTTVP
jgi:hypothetical protein